MAIKHYDWNDGPAILQQHSIAKHTIIQSYLSEYLKTLASVPTQDEIKLSLIDGFSGGGLFIHNDTKEEVLGSPFILLNAVKEAKASLNVDRKKPLNINASFFFIDNNPTAINFLKSSLIDRGYNLNNNKNIELINSTFHASADKIIECIKKKSPRSGRSIFILDQYGYNKVPIPLIKKIFKQLPSAEVILTFGVDSFINYANDSVNTQKTLDGIGIPNAFRGKTIEEIKKSKKEWRLFIQSCLYSELVMACGVRHYTPFFIRSEKGHGDYWLLHFSQHHRARDVMTQVHWKNNTHFIHYGDAGLDMFHMIGYDPSYDNKPQNQTILGFEFDDIAKDKSVKMLAEQIPNLIYSSDEGLLFGELFISTCNDTPASSEIYKQALGKLIDEKDVEIYSSDGKKRRSSNQINDKDQIIRPRQSKFNFL